MNNLIIGRPPQSQTRIDAGTSHLIDGSLLINEFLLHLTWSSGQYTPSQELCLAWHLQGFPNWHPVQRPPVPLAGGDPNDQ